MQLKNTTKLLNDAGLVNDDGKIQKVLDVTVYPREYLCPYNYITGTMKMTENTYSVHLYSMSWLGKAQIYKSKFTRILHRLFYKK